MKNLFKIKEINEELILQKKIKMNLKMKQKILIKKLEN